MITTWFQDTFPEGYGVAIMWTLAALLALAAVLILMRLVRAYQSGTFVAGGRNRKPRLSVMDATPVDAKRRLVLVRRDDVEHLILIGGANDLVVERGITLVERSPRSASLEDMAFSDTQIAAPLQAGRNAAPLGSAPPSRPEPFKPQRSVTPIRDLTPVAPPPARRPDIPASPSAAAPQVPSVAAARPRSETSPSSGAPASPQRPSGEAARPYVPPVRPAPESALPARPSSSSTTSLAVTAGRPADAPRSPAPAAPIIAPVRRPTPPSPTTSPAAPPAPKPSAGNASDADLTKELEQVLSPVTPPVTAPDDISLDDEMAKLLGELSGEKR